jgi:hypothetical protein
MGFLDRLLGRETSPAANTMQGRPTTGFGSAGGARRPMDADAQAVARYRYMLQTAPPEQIEQAHAEAFARLTPEQRRLALEQVSTVLPENERAGLTDDPQSLARAATRAEVRQPGALQNAFGGRGMGGGMGGMMGGMGGMMAGSILTSVAASFLMTSVASSFFSNPMHESGFQQSPEAGGDEVGGAADAGADMDSGAGSDFGVDLDSGFGDFGGDF